MASDVAYERNQFGPLLKSFETLVKPNGHILLSEPNRYIAEPFLNAIKENGYEMEKTNYEVMVRNIKSKVAVYAITHRKI